MKDKMLFDRMTAAVVFRNFVVGLVIGAVVAIAGSIIYPPGWHAPLAYASTLTDEVEQPLMAAPGRVEGSSETVRVGAGTDGILASLLVREGDRVRKGDVLATLAAGELVEDAAAVRHAVAVAIESRNVLLHGSRTEARLAAQQRRIAAQANAVEARLRFARIDRLYAEGAATLADRDQSRRDLDFLEAEALRAAHDEALVNAPALEEEVRRADAEIARAKAQAEAAALRAQKLQVRAPADGTILQILVRPGEAVSTVLPQPILTMADLTRLRVRAEIDEQDIARVWLGQPVRLSAIGLVSPEFTGQVEWLSPTMGRVQVRTGDPAEKSDRDIREVLIAVDKAPALLPIGLRVTARFYGSKSPHAEAPASGDATPSRSGT